MIYRKCKIYQHKNMLTFHSFTGPLTFSVNTEITLFKSKSYLWALFAGIVSKQEECSTFDEIWLRGFILSDNHINTNRCILCPNYSTNPCYIQHSSLCISHIFTLVILNELFENSIFCDRGSRVWIFSTRRTRRKLRLLIKGRIQQHIAITIIIHH